MRRERWRYLLVRIADGKNFSEGEFMSSLVEVVKDVFGLVGLSQISPRIVKYDESSREVILKCRTESVDKLRSAIALLTQIGGQAAAAFVIRSSGTIRALTRVPKHQGRTDQAAS